MAGFGRKRGVFLIENGKKKMESGKVGLWAEKLCGSVVPAVHYKAGTEARQE
jgi:hypothetical protein